MRHGQAISNVKALCSCWPEKFNNSLTSKGKAEIKESVKKLIDKDIDLIFASDLLRTKQSAGIIGKTLKIKPKFDKRLREVGFGIFNGKKLESMWKYFKHENERIKSRPPKGENYEEILKRMASFLKETDKKYKNRNILIISHEGPLCLLQGKVLGLSLKETIEKYSLDKRIHKGEIRELNYSVEEEDLLRSIEKSKAEFRAGKGKILRSLKDLR
jgi:broad specificity phosphatase PhoE